MSFLPRNPLALRSSSKSVQDVGNNNNNNNYVCVKSILDICGKFDLFLGFFFSYQNSFLASERHCVCVYAVVCEKLLLYFACTLNAMTSNSIVYLINMCDNSINISHSNKQNQPYLNLQAAKSVSSSFRLVVVPFCPLFLALSPQTRGVLEVPHVRSIDAPAQHSYRATLN